MQDLWLLWLQACLSAIAYCNQIMLGLLCRIIEVSNSAQAFASWIEQHSPKASPKLLA